MRRSTVSSRPRSSSSRTHAEEPQRGQAPPMEPSMTCMTVVEDGPSIAFACYDEDRNEILLETCRASGYDTEAVVKRFLQMARPTLVLVGNKIVRNAALLQMVTRPPPAVTGDDDDEEETNENENNNNNNNADTGQQQEGRITPSSLSIPYRLLKMGAFEVRACKALIQQKLRVLTLRRRQPAQGHAIGYDDPHRNDRHFPLAAGPYAIFRPSSYHSLAAVIDFDSKVQIQALGALLSFLQTTIFRLEEAGTITVNRIVQAKSSMYMHINAATFSALHIFATEHHPLIAKGPGNAKEGFSLYSLLDRTQSKGGRQLLREWMLKPLIDMQAIVERQNVIELFMQPNINTTAGVLLNLLGKVGPIDKIILRMQKCATQPMDFLVLTRTLSAAVAICNNLRNDILPRLELSNTNQSHGFLRSLCQRSNASVLIDLHEQISAIVDEEATNVLKTAVVIRHGFHQELDEWKDQYEFLEGTSRAKATRRYAVFPLTSLVLYYIDTLEEVGAEIHKRHPELDDLSVVFVPQVRHTRKSSYSS